MPKILLILLTFFTLSDALAEGKAFALIRKIQGVEQLPPVLSRQLEKLTLQVIAKQADYQLLLSGEDTPTGSIVDMVAVESEVGRTTNNQFRIETRLLDLKSKKLIRKASQDNIREEDLVRLFQGALEALFITDEKSPKAPEVRPNTVPPKTTPPKQASPITTQTNAPDAPTLNFRERVLALKAGVDEEIAKTLEEKEQSQSDAQKEAPKENTAAKQVSLSMGKSVMEDPFKKRDSGKKYEKQHTLFLGYDTRQNESSYFIATSTKVSLLTLRAQGHLPTSFLDGRTAYSYDVGFSRILSSPLPYSSPYQIGAYGTYLGTNYIGSFGLLRDTTFFANLPGPGLGLKEQNLVATWFRIKNEFLFDIKGPWKVGFNYGIPFQVESSYGPLKSMKKWSGNSMQFMITPPLAIKSWESALTFEKLLLTSSGERKFTLNETRFALLVRRSL